MTPYDETLARAEKQGIQFHTHKSKKMPAVGASIDGELAVSIDESAFDTDRDRRLAIVHEIKHCETGTFYNEYTPDWIAARRERRATKETVVELVSFEKVVSSYKQGIFCEYEQAEKWDVPLHFVKTVHEVYEVLYPAEVNELKLYIAENFS